MKVLKDNTVKLDKNEKRLGNFVVRSEESHMKVYDIGGVSTWRISKTTALGRFVELSYESIGEEGGSRGLSNYIAVLYSVFSAVPDLQYLRDVYESAKACIERHPEVYGYPKGEVSDEDDARVIEEAREMTSLEEEMKSGKV